MSEALAGRRVAAQNDASDAKKTNFASRLDELDDLFRTGAPSEWPHRLRRRARDHRLPRPRCPGKTMTEVITR
ncbi:hypothetical protein [Streptomyces brasiliensis]|uniref:hypothetical protein n=1 Tax=Streptomyces brasiliensis TaxID=1954 RepID=UPI00166FE36A|nr:hypothetical protein [Streptomyces brasiliensis]